MKVIVLGSGAYGIALALNLFENNHEVTLWTPFIEEKMRIEKTHENEPVLKGIKIPSGILITTDLDKVKESELIVIATPAFTIDSIAQKLKDVITNQIIVIASKGIEQDTCLFLNDVLAKHMNTQNVCVIAGGSFAIDIVSNMPVGLSLASKNEKAIKIVKQVFQNSHFKLRETDDIYGVEICSSIKNVIAIAAGILDGLGANESTKAMFITESLHDIKELIDKLGGDKKTILSFAGFGDILLTCTSEKSRNFTFGQTLAKSKEQAKEYLNSHTVEGVYTLKSIHQLIKDKNVDIGIINLIEKIVFHEEKPETLLKFLIEKQ